MIALRAGQLKARLRRNAAHSLSVRALSRSQTLSANENTIRDKLSENLSVIEEGLTVIDNEFRLKNEYGASGRVDILAKDVYGNYVVIELKRSDQAARQGIHELFKYLSILSMQLGIPSEKIRALLVSTTWHELTVPFSEYLKVTPFHTKGFEIKVDDLGNVISAKEVSTAPESKPIEYSSSQMLYLYDDIQKRESAVKEISSSLQAAHVDDYFLLYCDHDISNERVIYPYGIYIVFSSPLLTSNEEQCQKIKDSIDWDDELDLPDENFLVAMPIHNIPYTTAEIGYPEKLRKMAESWSFATALRSGRFKESADILTEEDIIKGAMHLEGGATYYLSKLTSPQFKEQWDNFKENLKYVILGNSYWLKIIEPLLIDIQQNHSDAKVSCYAYNLADTGYSLSKISVNDFRFLPSLQIVVRGKNSLRIIQSIATWNGQRIDCTPEEYIDRAYGSLEKWISYRHFGEQFQFDDIARSLAKLETRVYETRFDRGGNISHSEIKPTKSSNSRVEISALPTSSIDEYKEMNRSFFNEYYAFVSQIFHEFKNVL